MKQSSISVPQPQWKLFYSGENITGSIESMVTEVRWHEAMGSQAADMSVTVQDTQGKWHTSTYPQPNDRVSLSIGYAGAPLLDCGAFTIDEFEYRMPPRTMTLKGVEALTTANIRTPRSAAYENMTVTQIAQAIALNHQLDFVVGTLPLATQDVLWDRKTQALESDVNFLQRMADEHNFVFNIRSNQLVFLSRTELEGQPPVATITESMVRRAQLSYQNLADLTVNGAQNTLPKPVYKGSSERPGRGLWQRIGGGNRHHKGLHDTP